MEKARAGNIHYLPDLKDRVRVFRDRNEAGEVVAGMVEDLGGTDAIVLAVPAGGIPVASVIAERLDLPMDVAVVSKITLPWNTEAGYGAVAFDGTVRLNDTLIDHLNLSREVMEEGIRKTRDRVERRVEKFRGKRPLPRLSGRRVVVVDDGLASGFTMLVAVEAVRASGASAVTVAVPTGHLDSFMRIAHEVEALYCANARGGRSFAVADAYEKWYDVDEDEAVGMYRRFMGKGGA